MRKNKNGFDVAIITWDLQGNDIRFLCYYALLCLLWWTYLFESEFGACPGTRQPRKIACATYACTVQCSVLKQLTKHKYDRNFGIFL